MADDTDYTLQERRVRLSEQREARFQRAADQRSSSGGWSPGTAASRLSRPYRGNGMLAVLLLVGIALVAVRLVADFEIQEDGAVKGKVLHPQGQYGPIAILAALLATFFVLSLVAVGGGLRAKLAVIMGGAIVLTLGVRSIGEVKSIGATFGNIGQISVPAATGNLPDILGNAGSAGSAVAAAGAPGQAASSGLFGTATGNAYGADLRALEQLNLVKVVGDSVVWVGDAGSSILKKLGL